MAYFQDLRTCAEHGFTLSPEGTCVRCLREAAQAVQRARLAKVVAGSLFAVTLLGFGAAWGRMRSASAAPGEAPRAVTLGRVGAGAATEPADRVQPPPPVTSEATRVALHDWEIQLARAEAARTAELAAKAEAEKQRARAALDVPVADPVVTSTTPRRGRVETAPSSEDHPSWWQEPSYRRQGYGSVAAQQRAMAAQGVAPYNVTSPGAWLPPNNGGNFTTRSH